MNMFTLRNSLVAGAMALTQVPSFAQIVLDNTNLWLQDTGLSSLLAIPTIDFSFNSHGIYSGAANFPAFGGGYTPQFNEGGFVFNTSSNTLSQLFVMNSTNTPVASVSLVANPWSLKIVKDGGNQALAMGGPSPLDAFGNQQSAALGMQFSSACTTLGVGSCNQWGYRDGVKAVSFDLLNYQLQGAGGAGHPAQEGLLMVTYKNVSTGAVRSDYAEIFKNSSDTKAYSIGAVANLGEVIYQLNYFECFTTLDHANWLGCKAQAAVDNVRVVQAVPEPETYALMLGGLGLLALRSRSRRTVAVAA
jgi:hypothetical protein